MDNKDLRVQINSLIANSQAFRGQADHDEIWDLDVEALKQLEGLVRTLSIHKIPANEKELEAVLDDYKKQGEQLGSMILRYETEERPLRQGEMYLCPHCHHRIRINHEHCHWCGGLIGWDGNGGRHGKKSSRGGAE